jgi:hypothetical protein
VDLPELALHLQFFGCPFQFGNYSLATSHSFTALRISAIDHAFELFRTYL